MTDPPDLELPGASDADDRQRAERTIATLERLAADLARTDRALTRFTVHLQHDPEPGASPEA